MAAKTTSFVLGEKFEKFIAEQVASGEYGSASEVIREALRRMKRRKEREALEAKLLDEAEASGISPRSHEEIWADLHSRNKQQKTKP